MNDVIKFPTQSKLSKEDITNIITIWNEQLISFEKEEEEFLKYDKNYPILKKNYFNIINSLAQEEIHPRFISQFIERSNELLEDPYNDFYGTLVHASLLLKLGTKILNKDLELTKLMLRITIEGEINPHNYPFCMSYLFDGTFLNELRKELTTEDEQRNFCLNMVDLIPLYNITDQNQFLTICKKELKETVENKNRSTSSKLFDNTIFSTKTIYDIIKEQAVPFVDFTEERIDKILELDKFSYNEKVKFFRFIQDADRIENAGSYRKIGDILNATELCINDESYLTTKNIAELYISVMALAAESKAKGRK